MSALEKITREILEQAGAEAEKILSDARQKAAEILAKGEADRAAWQRQLDETTEQECRELASGAKSADRQNRRLALLAVRNQAIDEVIAMAKAALTAHSDAERFQITVQGNITLNHSIDAVFEAENQTLRDQAYAVLTA